MKTFFECFLFFFFPVFTFATALDPHITVDTFLFGSATISWIRFRVRFLLFDYERILEDHIPMDTMDQNATVSFVGLDLNTDYYFVLSVAEFFREVCLLLPQSIHFVSTLLEQVLHNE